MNSSDFPSEAVCKRVADLAVNATYGKPFSYYDLLTERLDRAKGMANLIGIAAFHPENLIPEALSETGFAMARELEMVLLLLDGWVEDRKAAECRNKSGGAR